MKRIGIMIYPEILDALEPLSKEEKGAILEMIIQWNKGNDVNPSNSLEKFVWATILPKLEDNKIKYQEISQKRTEAVNKRWKKTDDTSEYKSIQVNTNPNPNLIDSSKEESYKDQEDGKQETLDGVSISEEKISKGLEKLEEIFPQRKRDIGIDEINLWNGLSQTQKANLIRSATSYIRNESKNENGKFIKKLSKWMKEESDKGIKVEMKPVIKKESLTFSRDGFQDANMIVYLESIFSSREADSVYHKLNRLGLNKDELYNIGKTYSKEQILELINN